MSKEMYVSPKAKEIADKLIAIFESGNLSDPLARAIITHRGGTKPSARRSRLNQILEIAQGSTDARGKKQWLAVGRKVKSKAEGTDPVYIWGPNTKKAYRTNEETGEKEPYYYTYGFRAIMLFDISDTTGEPLEDDETQEWLKDLPFQQAATNLGVAWHTYDGTGVSHQGYYSRRKKRTEDGNEIATNQKIGLGVRHTGVWFHELVHAADQALGNLTEQGQDPISEAVAQIGAETLLNIVGEPEDMGFTANYVNAYCRANDLDPIKVIKQVIERTSDAVEHIINLAEGN